MKQKKSWCYIMPGKFNYWRQSYLYMLKKAALSLIVASGFLCLILHKIWLCCSLQSMEEKDYKKSHSKNNQCLGRNNFPAVLKILINFPFNIVIIQRLHNWVVLANTISYLEIQFRIHFPYSKIKENDILLYNLIFDPLKTFSVEI